MATVKDRPSASKAGFVNYACGKGSVFIQHAVPTRSHGGLERVDELFRSLLIEHDPASVAQFVVLAADRNLAKSKKPQSGLAAAMIRGVLARQTLKDEEGGGVSAEDARRFLGNISRQAVLDRFRKGKLLGWRETRQDAVRFPLWQFSEQGGMLPGMEDVLGILQASAAVDEWGAILFFLNRRSSLSGKRPLDALRAGKIEDVKREAHAYVAS